MPATADLPRPFLPPLPTGRGGARVISPAGPVSAEDDLTAGCGILRQAGIEVEIAEGRNHGYLAGSDSERLEELNAAFYDPAVESVLAARGGYGCQRLLPAIDPGLFRRNPKIICGASDVSILLNFIATRTGMITFHGPMAIKIAAVDRESRDNAVSLFKGTLPPPPPPFIPFRPGPARGRLLGGNLSVLTHLVGTPYAIPLAGAVVFFEEINEPLYRVDRMFQQLRQSGALTDAAAIVLGDFIFQGEKMAPDEIAGLAAEASEEKCPVWTGLACGHGERNLVLPVGCDCAIDHDGDLSFSYPS